MAFTSFTTGAVSSAAKVNNNFYHIAQGDRLPRGGSTLAPTTSVYNLGATATTWANMYANSIACTNIAITGSVTSSSMPYLIAEQVLTGTATQISFTGLHGDTDGQYRIEIAANANFVLSNAFSVGFNNISTVSYYRQTSVDRNSSLTSCRMYTPMTETRRHWATLHIYAKSGNLRTVLCNRFGTEGESGIYFESFIWNNTEDEITTITISTNVNQFNTGSSFRLWVI